MKNTALREQSFEIVVNRDGEELFHGTFYDVPAGGTDRPAPDRQNPNTHMIEPTWEPAPGDYEISGRFIGDESSDWTSMDLKSRNSSYLGAVVHFHRRSIDSWTSEYESEEERATARDFIESELERQSERDRYGREP